MKTKIVRLLVEEKTVWDILVEVPEGADAVDEFHAQHDHSILESHACASHEFGATEGETLDAVPEGHRVIDLTE